MERRKVRWIWTLGLAAAVTGLLGGTDALGRLNSAAGAALPPPPGGVDVPGVDHPTGTWANTAHGGCCEAYLATSDTASYAVITWCTPCDNVIKRSDDGGHGWIQKYPPAGAAPRAPGDFGVEGDIQADGQDVLYFGIKDFVADGSIFARSRDQGDHWTIIDNPVPQALDQPWLYLGPVQARGCPAPQQYALAMWPRLGGVFAFSCDRGDTWAVRVVPVSNTFPATHGGCTRDAFLRENALAGFLATPWNAEARTPNPRFDFNRAGMNAAWGTDGRYYWAEVTLHRPAGAAGPVPGLLICRTGDLGQTWSGRFEALPGLAANAPANTRVAFDADGRLYVLASNKLLVSEDNGFSFVRKHTLVAWGHALNNVSDGKTQWFTTREGTSLDMAFRAAQGVNPIDCGDPDGCLGMVRITNPASAAPVTIFEMINPELSNARLDFVMMAEQPSAFPVTRQPVVHVGYTLPGGVEIASRGA